jgi:hypothetical protein
VNAKQNLYFTHSPKSINMKKILIGGLVGGILLFAWQTISFAVANLHDKGQAYTPKQDSILQFLNNSGLEEGTYFMPRLQNENSSEEMEKFMKEVDGKPWAQLSYYKAWNLNMGMNMVRGLLANIIIVVGLCWIFAKITNASFGTYLTASLIIGLIAFTNGPYTGHIWYPKHDINAYFVDAIVSWGLVGAWLGWWMNRK